MSINDSWQGGIDLFFLPGFISATYIAQTLEFMQFQGHGKLRVLISKEEISIVIKYFYHMTIFPIKSNDHYNSHTEFPLAANMNGLKDFGIHI